MSEQFWRKLKIITVLLMLSPGAFGASASNVAGSARFERVVAQFEQQDRAGPVRTGGVLFVGSSSIAGWQTLPDDLADELEVQGLYRRGLNGAQISDLLHYFDRLVTPYRPQRIVFYGGENDISAGKAPETVLADVRRFVERVRAILPQTKIVFLSLKPSPARWRHWPAMTETNRLLESYVKSESDLAFVAVSAAMLSPQGQPKPELYGTDKLHLSRAGYALWGEYVNAYFRPGGGR